MGVFEEYAKNRSDWTDQDLLIYDEAGERLIALRAKLAAEIENATGDQQVAEARRRLELTETLLARYPKSATPE
ncbi:hypothetical protein [Gordonia terrae]